MNGKGDKSRVTDRQAYRSNYDQIDWSDKPEIPIVRGKTKYYAHLDEANFHGARGAMLKNRGITTNQ